MNIINHLTRKRTIMASIQSDPVQERIAELKSDNYRLYLNGIAVCPNFATARYEDLPASAQSIMDHIVSNRCEIHDLKAQPW